MAADPVTARPSERLRSVGAVAIGRNEGERLRRCFDSLPLRHVVYVDSASTDGSVGEARRRGIDVVELDLSIPFTAARARNEGLRRLRERWPEVAFVQVVDGDCALAPGWIEAALDALEADPRLAIACGRRRELHPDASIYNRLCDMEWDTAVGDATDCGGDALVRLAALDEVGAYDARLIAGEEPELCARLRARGWRIRRLDHEMTTHDAAMTRFRQWWRRTLRAGHAYAEVGSLHRQVWRRERRSILFWGVMLPVAAGVASVAFGPAALLLLAAYPALWARVFVHRRARGEPAGASGLYAAACVAGKVPEAAGMLRFWRHRLGGRRSALIEYK